MIGRFTARDKERECAREIGQRRRVYPRMIESGRMTQTVADRQIAILEEIRADYAAQIDAERAKGDLFGATQ